MAKLEQAKFYAPKYTGSIVELLDILNIEIDKNKFNTSSIKFG